jgi:molybdate transport system permease protein
LCGTGIRFHEYDFQHGATDIDDALRTGRGCTVIDLAPMMLSFKIAILCTGTLIIIGIPCGYWLSLPGSYLRLMLRSLIMLPLVLPPSVLGFYFLLLWSPTAPIGAIIEHTFHLRLVFSFWGLVIASSIAGIPFMLTPVIAGFESLSPSLREASRTLGKNEFETLMKVLVPAIRPSLLTGAVMTFMHTFGEFGLVLMLGGKIPGKTVTASIALYDHVESLEYAQAHIYAAVITFSALAALFSLFIVNTKPGAKNDRH